MSYKKIQSRKKLQDLNPVALLPRMKQRKLAVSSSYVGGILDFIKYLTFHFYFLIRIIINQSIPLIGCDKYEKIDKQDCKKYERRDKTPEPSQQRNFDADILNAPKPSSHDHDS